MTTGLASQSLLRRFCSSEGSGQATGCPVEQETNEDSLPPAEVEDALEWSAEDVIEVRIGGHGDEGGNWCEEEEEQELEEEGSGGWPSDSIDSDNPVFSPEPIPAPPLQQDSTGTTLTPLQHSAGSGQDSTGGNVVGVQDSTGGNVVGVQDSAAAGSGGVGDGESVQCGVGGKSGEDAGCGTGGQSVSLETAEDR